MPIHPRLFSVLIFMPRIKKKKEQKIQTHQRKQTPQWFVLWQKEGLLDTILRSRERMP